MPAPSLRRGRSLAVALAIAGSAGCDPNFRAGDVGPERPPAWSAPPMAEGDAHAHDPHEGSGAPDLSSVVAELESALAADPGDIEARRKLATVQLDRGRWDEVLRLADEGLAKAPNDVSLRVLRARVHLQKRDTDAAKVDLVAAATRAPDDEAVLRAYGSFHILAEDLPAAVKARRRLLAKHPGIEDYETVEREAFYLERFPALKAKQKLKEFFDLVAAAKTRQEDGRHDEAIDAFGKALALIPDDPNLLTDRGLSQRKGGRSKEGIESFRKALSIARTHSNARLELARAQSEDGDKKAAAATLEEWLRLDPRRAKRHHADEIAARLKKGGEFDGVAGEPGEAGVLAGRIEIEPSLAAKVPAGASLFVFAKASPSDRMPVAVLREPLGGFPASFSLTKENMMMEGGAFEGPLYVTARIDGDGTAGSRPGDLEGTTAQPVTVGTRGVVIVINHVVGGDAGGPATASGAPHGGPPGGGALAAGGVPPAGGGSVSGGTIRGTVQVSPSLAARVPSNATLFVFAKENPGDRMPLAVVREPVSTFPVAFSLSEANVMGGGRPFAGRLFLTARIDSDGIAGAGPGDMEGTTPGPVAVGTEGVSLTIDTVR